jgi:hypothetical protein
MQEGDHRVNDDPDGQKHRKADQEGPAPAERRQLVRHSLAKCQFLFELSVNIRRKYFVLLQAAPGIA